MVIQPPPQQAVNEKIVNVEGIVLLIVHIGALLLPCSSEIVENLAVDVLLKTLFTEQCMCSIFKTKW